MVFPMDPQGDSLEDISQAFSGFKPISKAFEMSPVKAGILQN